MLRTLRERLLVGILACAALAGLGVGLASVFGGKGKRHPPAVHARRPSSRPNIVFILTDDLSMDLLRYMPHVQAMQQQGLTFENYFVTDSLCCPSRASIFTGDFPHDTEILNNVGPHGGFDVFHDRGEERRSFSVALQRAGYATAMMGKYLNGYLQRRDSPNVPPTYVPPGWSEWDVAGWGYREFRYRLNDDGSLNRYGHAPSDYLTDVISRKGVEFIGHAAREGKPFFLELATFAPHSPYVPAPRDAGTFPGLHVPRPPSFDRLPTDAPRWLSFRAPLTPTQIAQIDRAFRLRVESVQSVDRMIGAIEQAVAAHGLARQTYLVFSSDNGLHMGEYRLMPGKMAAFDTDIHVPLIVVGPHVPAGRTTTAMTENVDLAKTFAAIAGATMPGDGHSLLPLVSGQRPAGWRNAILVEHRGPNLNPFDPDFQQPASGNPPAYRALRTSSFLYVEYRDGERELYDLRTDPFELHDIASLLTRAERARLHRELARLAHCHGGTSCWRAAHISQPTLAGTGL